MARRKAKKKHRAKQTRATAGSPALDASPPAHDPAERWERGPVPGIERLAPPPRRAPWTLRLHLRLRSASKRLEALPVLIISLGLGLLPAAVSAVIAAADGALLLGLLIGPADLVRMLRDIHRGSGQAGALSLGELRLASGGGDHRPIPPEPQPIDVWQLRLVLFDERGKPAEEIWLSELHEVARVDLAGQLVPTWRVLARPVAHVAYVAAWALAWALWLMPLW